MSAYSVVARNRCVPDAAGESLSVDKLFQIMITRIASEGSAEASVPDEKSTAIILHTEFNGFSYALVRLRKTSRGVAALSPREREIVRMVAQGQPNKVIAGVLNISPWTVCTHLRRIFAKLGVGSRAAMVARSIELIAVCDERLETGTKSRIGNSTD